MSKTYFISFSGSVDTPDETLLARQTLLNHSALTISNADEAIAWTREDLLDSDFYKRNQRILNQARGAGFWAWKPYVISKTLDQIGPNDWVVYSDIGKPFRRGDATRAGNLNIGNVMNSSFDSIIRYADNQGGFTPGIWIPHYGNAKVWTKRDCFVGMGCDDTQYHNSGQVQAGYSCWSNSKASRTFLQQWLNWVQVEAVITDQSNIYGKPNFPEFRDHRHDQSVMTNLVIKNNIQLFGPRTRSLDGFRDFNLILRHMALSDELADISQQFALLFDPKDPVILPYALQALRLWLLPELKHNNRILVQDSSQQNRWQAALPNCDLYFAAEPPNNQQDFAGIFVNQCQHQDSLPRLLASYYEALAPGGVLVFGPYQGSKDVEASLDKGFSELVQWMFVNQRFPEGLSTQENQRANAITIGNAQNPYIASLPNNQSQVILRKPHFQLGA